MKFADRRPLLQAPIDHDAEAGDLARWDDTDPDTWPAEWADVPIPFRLADLTPPLAPTRGVKRRRFLGLLTTGAALGLSILHRPAQATATAGPLGLAWREVQRARAECRRVSAEVEALSVECGFEAAAPFEGRAWEAQCGESRARGELVRRIAQAAGVTLEAPPLDWDIDSDLVHRAVAVAREGAALYLLVANECCYFSPHDEEGVAAHFRPIVVDLGGLL